MTTAAVPPLEAERSSACTVCGAADFQTVASAAALDAQRRQLRRFHQRRLRRPSAEALEERADFTQDYAASIVRCRDCGLLLREPRPRDEAVLEAYAADRYGEERLDALFDSQLELFRPKARGLRRWLRPGATLLEVGSFVGGFLAAAAELGWNAVGIDPGREVSQYCRARGLSVLCEDVAVCEFGDAAADAVAIWNTFDQLPDPRPTLRFARRVLRRDGLLAIRVPNGAAFSSTLRLLDKSGSDPDFADADGSGLRGLLFAAMAWNNLVGFPYLHGYSRATLDRLLSEEGFESVHEHRDVLTRLSDETSRRWAAVEEALLKTAWKLAANAPLLRRHVDAPWLDLYYRLADGSPPASAAKRVACAAGSSPRSGS